MNKLQKIIQERLKQYTDINSDGELVALPKYGTNYKIQILYQTKTLKQWVYYLNYSYFPNGRIRQYSTNKLSLDPLLLHVPSESF